MMKEQLKVGVFAMLGLMAGTAFAQQGGWYVRGDIGHSQAVKQDFTNDTTSHTFQVLTTPGGVVRGPNNSSVYDLGAGYQYASNWRADITYSVRHGYRLSGVDTGTPTAMIGSDIKSDALFATAYRTFELASVKPYLGLGLGWARNKMASVSIKDVTNGVDVTALGGTKNNLAWQFAAGVDIPVEKRFTIDVGYRYVDLGKARSGVGNATVTAPVLPAGTATDTDAIVGKLKAHELSVGARYQF